MVERAAAYGVLTTRLVPNLASVVLHERRLQHRGSVGERRVDVLALPRAASVQHRKCDRVRAEEAGAVVVHCILLQLRLALASESLLHTGGGLRDLLVTRAAGVRSDVPVGIE